MPERVHDLFTRQDAVGRDETLEVNTVGQGAAVLREDACGEGRGRKCAERGANKFTPGDRWVR